MGEKSRDPQQRATVLRQRSRKPGGSQRRPLILGGLLLLLVVITIAGIRIYRQRNVLLQLQSHANHHYMRGTADAAVVIKEFSDYTCPHCKTLQEPLERALKRYEHRVQLVAYPLALNSRSEKATQLAWCAGEQGKFWEMHRMLYQRQGQWSHLLEPSGQLLDYSGELALDTEALKSCVQSGRMATRVKADQDHARRLQVRSTPTVFINNQRLVGAQTEADYVRTIRQELARAERHAGS